ncbi:MAG: D-sedoheptulose-7-phosphate isomerase [Gaiellales bacterium]
MSTATEIDEWVEHRTAAGEAFFDREAPRLAELCRGMAERFLRGGRLLAVADSPQGWSDARHVAVEFVHPVIVGKRALPAMAVDPGGLPLLARPEDMVIDFTAGASLPAGCLPVSLEPDDADPFVRQEIVETAYHVLWELVHVFFDHLEGSSAGAGAAGFLYPFLDAQEPDLDAVVADVQASMLMKSREVAALRARTVVEGREQIVAGAAAVRSALEAGGMVLAFGNGGSATDAMDLVADLRSAPQGWPARAAVDLAEDPAILTAVANDVGAEVMFQRQVIAHGRPGDVAVAISTSGNSANILAALEEARRRRLVTVALVGYDGGRVAAEQLADHVVVTRSQHIPRIQEAQATAYHVLRELVESSGGR